MLKRKLALAGAALLMTGASAALAHVSLEDPEAQIGSTYKAVLRVPHGCDGKPTVKIRVQIPEGVIAVKPMPKAGWKLDKVTSKYQHSYDYFGKAMDEGVTEVIWSDGTLADDEYDEFVFRAFLNPNLKVGKSIYFPLVQECSDGAMERWIEIPAEGRNADDYEMPAPGTKIVPKK